MKYFCFNFSSFDESQVNHLKGPLLYVTLFWHFLTPLGEITFNVILRVPKLLSNIFEYSIEYYNKFT